MKNIFSIFFIATIGILTNISKAHSQEEVDIITAYASGCCKVCTTSKACGDSCISKSFNCSKPAGCACNSGGSSGGGNNSGGKGGKDDKGKGDDGKNSTPIKVGCPKFIANKSTGTYSGKGGFECFTKASGAEKKGYTLE